MAEQKMMRALRYHGDGLRIDEVPVPTPGPRDVLIKVHATAITNGELTWPETKAREAPIPGHDVVGEITTLGSEVKGGFAKGDKVFALSSFLRDGGVAEYVAVSYKEVAHMPANFSYEEAASIPLSALWVYQALSHHLYPKSGEKVHVTGAGGGVGVMAVQLARNAGLIVSATCSADKMSLVRSLGASQVFDYTKTTVDDVSHDYTHVIDCVGGTVLTRCFKLLKGGGKLVSVARPPTAEEKASRPDVEASYFIVEPDGDELEEIACLCEEGNIKGVVEKVVPFEDAVGAFELLDGHTTGKVVIKVC